MPAKTKKSTTPRLSELRPEVLDLNDLVELEEAFGPLETLNLNSLKVLRFILWRFLLHTEPEVTLEQSGTRYNIEQVMAEARLVLERSGIASKGEPQGNAEAPIPGRTSTGS